MNVSRRQIVIDGLRATMLVPAALQLSPLLSRKSQGGRVLVVLQLTGGNDGLNTVAPHRQDSYYRLRPTLALARSKLVAIDPDHGLHPALAALAPLLAEGRLSVVQGVGYPNPDRSHFRSLEIWHGGDTCDLPRTGWLGRMADQIANGGGVMPALCVGEEEFPFALVGERVLAPTVLDEASLRLSPIPGLEGEREHILSTEDGATGDLVFLREAARVASLAARRLEEALARRSSADYPDLRLARELRLVARLIAGGFDTRIFHLALGGFDTHARQAEAHASLLEELGRSLAAFERDLAASGSAGRVMTLVHSEFGRRAGENGSRGTDHGAAAPVFLLGGPGRGGLKGTPPDLERLIEGDVAFTTDFRALYAAVERDWMGLDPTSSVPPFDLG